MSRSARQPVTVTPSGTFPTATGAPGARAHVPTTPLSGYRLLELEVADDSPALGQAISEIRWPRATIPVARSSGGALVAARRDDELRAGERLIVLAPTAIDADAGDSRRR